MQLYNALAQKVEPFVARDERVTVYVCGITPYDTTHMGHCFTYATFDVLVRYLEYLGYVVLYTQNVTDIDDDILRKAGQIGDDWQSLGNRWTTHFIDDNQALNMRPPDYFPRATDVIPEIVDSVQTLLKVGVAYEVAGNVYFHIASDPDYGRLSRLHLDEMLPIANERGNNPDDPHKRHPLDFVLWQAQAPGEPAWDSPWGPGRPGWHIECSTMSDKFLGQPIDIHGGGADLLFPHHESEIAQAELATGQQPFARYWMHAAMLRYQGEKMSKSLGNLVMVRDLLKEGWPADAIRLCMARHHYRQAWNFEIEELTVSSAMAAKLKAAVTVRGGRRTPPTDSGFEAVFQAAMSDDLDTPAATQALVREAETIITAAEQGQDVSQAQKTLRRLAAVLGLRLDQPQPEDRVLAGWQEHRQRFGDF